MSDDGLAGLLSAVNMRVRSLPIFRILNLLGWFVLKYGLDFIESYMAKIPNAVNQPSNQPSSFEEAMTELEQLVAQMEAGELPLEASVTAYKRGSELVKYCAAQLDKVDSQVKVLEGEMLKPFAADVAIEADE